MESRSVMECASDGAVDKLKDYTYLFGVAQAVGALLLLMVSIWTGVYRGGFAWTSSPQLEFNWHPLLMVLGLVYTYGNSILIFRTFRNTRKPTLKYAHATMNSLCFIMAAVGLKAVFDSHNLASPPIPNLYSLHSWIGLTAVIFFACQWLMGFFSFLYPIVGFTFRSSYLPIHVFFGILIFVLAVCAALTGLTEKAIFSVKNYSTIPAEGLIVNFIGVILIIFGSLIVFLVSKLKYKRQPLPEDECLLTPSNQPKEKAK